MQREPEFDTYVGAHEREHSTSIRLSNKLARNVAVPFQQSTILLLKLSPILSFAFIAILVSAPLLAHLYLPLVDLPNHIARHFLATSTPGPLDQYYDYSIGLVPNSAVDLLWILTGGHGDPTRFSQMSMVFASVGLVAATMLLSRTIWGEWMAWPAAVGLFAYNANFLWGFQNYVVALPVVLAGMALWLATERHGLGVRLIALAPLILLLFLMHFFAFIGFAAMVFGRETQRIVEARRFWKRQTLNSIVLALPFLFCISYLVYSILSSEPSPAGSFTAWGHWTSRIEALSSLALGGGQLSLPKGLTVSGALTLALVGVFLYFIRRTSGLRLELRPEMRGVVIALSVLVLVTPIWLNGVAFVHIRFPVLLAATLLAATRWRGLTSNACITLSGAVLALILLRSVQFGQFAAQHDRDVREFISVIEAVPTGSRVLPVRSPDSWRDKRLWHVSAYSVVYVGAFVPTLFQGTHGLKVRAEWKDYSTPALHAASTDWLHGMAEPDYFLVRYVADWQQKYTHVVMLDRSRNLLDSFERLNEIKRSGRFTLYEITPRTAPDRNLH